MLLTIDQTIEIKQKKPLCDIEEKCFFFKFFCRPSDLSRNNATLCVL